MLLEAKNVWFGYRKNENVLKGVSFSVQSGEKVGVIAPSGYGKTTLCRILAGYLKPWDGQVTLDGYDVYDIRGYCPVQMIWQHPESCVNPRIPLRDTLAEGGPIDERIIEGLGIDYSWMNRYPGELSGGELQRFCIARSLGEGTRFLIADEISTMLDMVTQAQVWSFLLSEIEQREMGLIVVTHNQSLAKVVCGDSIQTFSE